LTNQFPGLARGPIDHEASSVINVIAGEAITMGSAVKLKALSSTTAEILPRVEEVDADVDSAYGIAIGGDADGIYGDGLVALTDLNRASAAEGDAIVVLKQGRCLARVTGKNAAGIGTTVNVGDPLAAGLPDTDLVGLLVVPVDNDFVVARALQKVESGATDIIAIDFQREGIQG